METTCSVYIERVRRLPALCTFEGMLSFDEYVNSIAFLLWYPVFLGVPCRAAVILIGVLKLERHGKSSNPLFPRIKFQYLAEVKMTISLRIDDPRTYQRISNLLGSLPSLHRKTWTLILLRSFISRAFFMLALPLFFFASTAFVFSVGLSIPSKLRS